MFTHANILFADGTDCMTGSRAAPTQVACVDPWTVDAATEPLLLAPDPVGACPDGLPVTGIWTTAAAASAIPAAASSVLGHSFCEHSSSEDDRAHDASSRRSSSVPRTCTSPRPAFRVSLLQLSDLLREA